jgi:C1A family cysteine protease
MSESVIDSGCSMTDAIEALEEFGTCLESIWPYDILHVNKRPHDEAYEQAENHKIHEALQINLDLNEMKSCLAQGFPFAFGLRLYKSFDKAAKYGIVSIPTAWEKTRKSTGRFDMIFIKKKYYKLIYSHALLAVGYSDRSKAFIVRNSWGEKWVMKNFVFSRNV